VSAKPNKGHYLNLLRHCGYGVPNLDRALWSLSNSLTLGRGGEVAPVRKEPGKGCESPRHASLRVTLAIAQLEALGDAEVEMRVTLSYFIEPNPSERGRSRYGMSRTGSGSM